MLTMNELLMNKVLEDQSREIQDNLAILLNRANSIREAWGHPMTVTSGLRTLEDHIRIYRQKAEAAGHPFDLSKVPMHSKHLIGAAVDISDPALALTAWLKKEEQNQLIETLWFEEGNKNWVHMQIFPPLSGKRWFLP